MKKSVKKTALIVIIILLLILCLIYALYKYKGIADCFLPSDISPVQTELSIKSLDADFYFFNKKIEFSNKPYIKTGRIYIPLYETSETMGAKVTEDNNYYNLIFETGISHIYKQNDNLYPKRIINTEGVIYVSFFEFLKNSGYTPVFDSTKNRVDIFLSQKYITTNDVPFSLKETSSAYLRLEDIMADGIDPKGYYNDVGLEKLRAVASYLYQNNQKFYIAWIPLYKNPMENIENDLTKDFNLYNASFLYTLDYLVSHGGKIGLHGLTHQYNNEKSADGYEFGKDTPYSEMECAERMLHAKEIARDLGYEVYFFEFPHYAATSTHLRYAEKYYNVIYQQDTSTDKRGTIVNFTRADNRNIKYVPTPADYISNIYDIDGINSRIDDSIKNGYIISLFYHPKIDFEVMITKTENNIRICNVPENSAIYRVIEKIFSEKLTFDYFDNI